MLKLAAILTVLVLGPAVGDPAFARGATSHPPCTDVCKYKFRVGERAIERKSPPLPDVPVRVRVWINGKELVPVSASGYLSTFVSRGVLVETRSRPVRAPIRIRAANARSKRATVKVTIRVLEDDPEPELAGYTRK